MAPDLFLSISSESTGTEAPSFNPVVVLAVVSRLAEREPALVHDVVASANHVLAPKLVAFKRRPWGNEVGGGFAFHNSIQDLHVTGLFKPGRRHERPVDLNLFADEWSTPPPAQR